MGADSVEYVAVVQGGQEMYGEQTGGLLAEAHAESKHCEPASIQHAYLGV